MTRSVEISGSGQSIVLDDPRAFYAIAGASGFGLAPRTQRWWTGVGDGSKRRGQQFGRRKITLPISVLAADRATLAERLSTLALALSDEAVLRIALENGSTWTTGVALSDGGDFAWGETTNGSTWMLPDALVLESGDPFWTAEAQDPTLSLEPSSGGGLLGTGRSLVYLRLSASGVVGTYTVTNTGDAPAWPLVLLQGPATSLTLTSPTGDVLAWAGALLAGQSRQFDHRAKTVVDQAGNRTYSELGPAPVFWPLPPGVSSIGVNLVGSGAGSRVTIGWLPRRQMVV